MQVHIQKYAKNLNRLVMAYMAIKGLNEDQLVQEFWGNDEKTQNILIEAESKPNYQQIMLDLAKLSTLNLPPTQLAVEKFARAKGWSPEFTLKFMRNKVNWALDDLMNEDIHFVHKTYQDMDNESYPDKFINDLGDHE